jgi:hypothetical protein
MEFSMFTRLALLTTLVVPLAARSASAADLPAGTWKVNVAGKTGELVITKIAADGTVTGKLLGRDIIAHWDGEVFTLTDLLDKVEGCLISEPDGKGKTKYTLAGVRHQTSPIQMNAPPPVKRTGWYAQITIDTPAPAGQIKVEVKGTIVCKDTTSAYVSVKQPDAFGREEETRVYFWLSEGEWKYWRDVLPKLNGQAVTVTGAVTQLPKGHQTSIPEGAIYFRGGFTIKTATETFP